jgi:hypothetical protein
VQQNEYICRVYLPLKVIVSRISLPKKWVSYSFFSQTSPVECHVLFFFYLFVSSSDLTCTHLTRRLFLCLKVAALLLYLKIYEGINWQKAGDPMLPMLFITIAAGIFWRD